MEKIDQWFLAVTYLFSLHTYKSFSVLPYYIYVLGLIRSMRKTFNLLTYPLSYSSLQEEAVSKEKFNSYKALVTKKGQGNVIPTLPGWGSSDIEILSTMQCEEIFQLRFQFHFQTRNSGPDICPITVIRFST